MRAAWALGEVAGGTNRGRTFGLNAEYKNGPIYAGVGFSDQKNALGTGSNKQFIVGATYNFGVAYLGGTYMENKSETGSKTKVPVVSLTVPFGASRIAAQYGQAKNGSNKATTLGLIAENDLSKRTTAYLFAGQGKNNGLVNAFDGNTAANVAAVKGQKSSAFGVGVRHRF